MPSLQSIVFYGLSVILVVSAILVVSVRNIFYGAVYLIAALTAVAGLFLLWGADFLGAAQILVYVGGIMIIMLFVVMFSQQPRDQMQRQTNQGAEWMAALFISSVIAITLVRASRVFIAVPVSVAEMGPTSASIGRLLLGDMLLPFEAVSLILLAALIGAVLFGQDKIS